jgi:hypothetical protein
MPQLWYNHISATGMTSELVVQDERKVQERQLM